MIRASKLSGGLSWLLLSGVMLTSLATPGWVVLLLELGFVMSAISGSFFYKLARQEKQPKTRLGLYLCLSALAVAVICFLVLPALG